MGSIFIDEEVQRIERNIDNFVESLKGGVHEGIYDVMHSLYGQIPTDEEIILSQAALSLILTATFYEHVRATHPQLSPLSDHVNRRGAIEGFKMALDDLMRVDYRDAIKLSRGILDKLPLSAADRVKELIEEGIRIAQNKALLSRDLAGRVYHKITGDIAVRKGFATFYTQVPAAHLLATLAVRILLGLEGEPTGKEDPWELVSRAQGVKVADFACGSGTLLTASYSALMRVLTELVRDNGLGVDLDVVGKGIIEDGIYGIDALKYAAQMAAMNLALISPGNIVRENIHTMYLGYMPEKNQPRLGSLELLINGRGIIGEGLELPEKFDLIIMNPPFTRATGRVSDEYREKGLFGFVTEGKYREMLRKRLDEVRRRANNELRDIARSLARNENLPNIIREIINGRGEFKQYLSIGQAGEGLLFLYLAYKYVKPGGVIAFVLPKNVLSGISWFLARALLASKFHVKYVIVSNDAENGYNFSEGTSLSEALIVAERVDGHEPSEETRFIMLMRKPKTDVEAALLAEKILEGNTHDVVMRVGRADLLSNLDNWGLFVSFSDAGLIGDAISIMRGSLCGVNVPTTLLHGVIKSIGTDRHQFNDGFELTGVETPYPVLFGGGEEVRISMMIGHNMFALPRNERARGMFTAHAGNVLIPDRIRVNTAHVIALYSEEALLSNIFYSLRLKCGADKALVVWLNTTFGVLTVLAKREETEGVFTRLNNGQWKVLPVLDVCALDSDVLKRLNDVFDKYAKTRFRRIPEQYGDDPDPARLSFDLDFLKALNPSIDEDKAKQCLINLYAKLGKALRMWMGENS